MNSTHGCALATMERESTRADWTQESESYKFDDYSNWHARIEPFLIFAYEHNETKKKINRIRILCVASLTYYTRNNVDAPTMSSVVAIAVVVVDA